MNGPIRLLLVGAVNASPAVPADEPAVEIERAASLIDAQSCLGADAACDVVVLDAASVLVSAAEIDAIVARSALVVVVSSVEAEPALGWIHRGADDVMAPDELAAAAGWRRLRFAVERRRRGDVRRPAYATDPSTGLPHRQQFVEHLSQLLALREREPAPMAVLALRVEAPAHDGDGAETAVLLRRKAGVRLRTAVRASDIVAYVGDDTFAILLGSVLAPADAARVADKLAAGVVVPFSIGGAELSASVALGLAHYPGDGNQADRLLRRALALAAVAPPMSVAGPAAGHDATGALRQAANDER